MTCKEMLEIIEKGVYEGTFQTRREGETVPQGLSLTDTGVSQTWRFREGNKIYRLHRRASDNHECFSFD